MVVNNYRDDSDATGLKAALIIIIIRMRAGARFCLVTSSVQRT